MNTSLLSELSLADDWEQECLFVEDEELSSTSHDDASKVLERWQCDDEFDQMEIDEPPVSTIFMDDIVIDICRSPTGPFEELAFLKLSDDEMDKFSTGFLQFDDIQHRPVHFEEQYNASAVKLAESMRRSQESRKCLTMKTSKMERYERTSSLTGILTSVEYSSQQLQSYLPQSYLQKD